jgi:hypothetical protein
MLGDRQALVDTEQGNPNSNPLFSARASRRSTARTACSHPDGKLVIMAGGPDYGLDRGNDDLGQDGEEGDRPHR